MGERARVVWGIGGAWRERARAGSGPWRGIGGQRERAPGWAGARFCFGGGDRFGSVWVVGGREGRLLPLQVVDVVLGVDGEYVGFVEVVRRSVGVEGAYAEQSFGGQVVDGDGFAGAGVAAFVEGDGVAGILAGEDAEFVEEGPDFAGAVAGDEVDAQAGAGLAELDGGGGVEDNGVGGRPGIDDGPDEPVLGWGRGHAAAGVTASSASASIEAGGRGRQVTGGRGCGRGCIAETGRRRRQWGDLRGGDRGQGNREKQGHGCDGHRPGALPVEH